MILDNRFDVEKQIGRGGLGTVYLATDLTTGARVVVKRLLDHPDSATREWMRRHFRDEGLALARLDHPNIIKFVASGVTADGEPYLATEYVAGGTLRPHIDPERGVADFEWVAGVMRELGSALSAANDNGIYHRDLKPENILLTPQGTDGREHVKVIDFGIATVKERLDEKTKATVLAGSVQYMSPEQLQGTPSALSDIYALGVVAYELLTGRRPFNPDLANALAAMQQLLELQRGGVRAKPKDLRPSLPEAAQAAVLKALAFRPRDRYARADDFGDALADALGERTRAQSDDELEIAFVLFVDIVGYSILSMDQQAKCLRELQVIVSGTAAFRTAQTKAAIVSLPTGDGMALAFFSDPLAPVRCAVQIAQGLEAGERIPLRMGINAGPVYRVDDINANSNVAGGGINLAQRVMDAGDAGHILLSQNAAEVLLQLSEWKPYLRDLGTHAVKHAVKVHLYNLFSPEFGNPEIPKKLRSPEVPNVVEATVPAWIPPVLMPKASVDHTEKRVTRRSILAVVGVLAIVVSAAAWAIALRGGSDAPLVNSNTRQASDAAPAAPAGTTLALWAKLQPYKNGVPNGAPMRLSGGVAGETYFSTGDRLEFFVTPSIDGFLYLINEEAGATPKLRILFPTQAGSGTAVVRASQVVATGECVFDASSGTERVWVIWSARQLPELDDAVRAWANPAAAGEIKGAAEASYTRGLFERHANDALQWAPDPVGERMVVGGPADPIVFSLKLQHR